MQQAPSILASEIVPATLNCIMSKRPAPPPPPPHSTSTPKPSSTRSNETAKPLILMSGYLTKRTRTLLHWKRRWWQLLGDGTLIYFQGRDRHKMLREIDIAHTCYDIQLGADHCPVSFPPIIGDQCCFSFSILKRTYYVYAPSPSEARRWTDSLMSASYLLNRNRPRELSTNPAVLVAAEALDRFAPAPPCLPPPPSKPPAILPREPSSSPEEAEESQPTMHSFSQTLSRPSYHYSVPDLRFDETSRSESNPGLWLDGSPQIRHAHGRPVLRERALSQLALVSPSNSEVRENKTRRATVSSIQNRAAKQASAGLAFCGIPEHDLIVSDTSNMGGTLPSRARQAKAKRQFSMDVAVIGLGSSYERLEQLQDREDAIRSRLRELDRRSKAYAKRAVPLPRTTLPLSAFTYSPVILPPTATNVHYSSPEEQSNPSQQKPMNQPQKPPRPPKYQKMKRKSTPFFVEVAAVPSSNQQGTDQEEWEDKEGNEYQPSQEVGEVPDLTELTTNLSQDQLSQKQTSKFWGVSTKSSSIRAQDANKWAKSQIRKVCERRQV